jgi:hypothetical protein
VGNEPGRVVTLTVVPVPVPKESVALTVKVYAVLAASPVIEELVVELVTVDGPPVIV